MKSGSSDNAPQLTSSMAPFKERRSFDVSENSPLVSIITIFHNAARFIEESIESVLAQTCGNSELLLVNDGSSDESEVIALRYVRAYPRRIRCLHHPGRANRGMSASRNLGLSAARGDLIAFLDADDVWLPQKLERQIELLLANPKAEMVCGPTLLWRRWGDAPNGPADSVRELGISSEGLKQPPQLLRDLLLGKIKTPATCSVLIRRGAIERIGGFEERFRGMYEDQAFFAKAYLALTIFASRACWDKYRQHPNSCCAEAQRAGLYHPKRPNLAHKTFLEWLADHLHEQQIQDADLLRALRLARRPYRHPAWHRVQVALKHPAEYLTAPATAALRRIIGASMYERTRQCWRWLRGSSVS